MAAEHTLDSKIAALGICPEFKVTSLGPYIKNNFVEFADKEMLHQPNMQEGLTINNYQNWLDWAYEELAQGNSHNPLLEYSKDLNFYTQGKFKIPWLMSFAEKGFVVSEKVRTESGLFFKTFKNDGDTFERELIYDRFGKPVLIERCYEKEDLYLVFAVFEESDKHFVIRIDDPDLWGYQYNQALGVFTLNCDREKIVELSDANEPLIKAVTMAFLRSEYTHEIVCLKNS